MVEGSQALLESTEVEASDVNAEETGGVVAQVAALGEAMQVE